MKSVSYILYFLGLWNCVLLNSGALSLSREKRLINGRDTEPNEIKYIVAFQNATEHLCGGSIISDQHILTAAHCVIVDEIEFRDFPLKIIGGVNDLNAEPETKVVLEVEKIYVSDRYNHSYWSINGNPLDDIAVLKLKEKLDIEGNPGLAIVDLPPKPVDEIASYVNLTVKFAGFGYDYMMITYENETLKEHGNSTGKLHKANVLIVENTECDDAYTGYNITVIHDETQICGRVKERNNQTDQGPCTGDSGSPLVYDNTVIGFLSSSVGGCNDNLAPSTYTKVQPFLDFIANAMNDVVADGMRIAVLDSNDEF